MFTLLFILQKMCLFLFFYAFPILLENLLFCSNCLHWLSKHSLKRLLLFRHRWDLIYSGFFVCVTSIFNLSNPPCSYQYVTSRVRLKPLTRNRIMQQLFVFLKKTSLKELGGIISMFNHGIRTCFKLLL